MNTLCMGALLGLSIAVPPGPNAAICMSRTLVADRKVGLRCGLGAASAHAIYATLAVLGVDRAAGVLDKGTFALHIAGGLLLVAFGLRPGRTGPCPRRVRRAGRTSALGAPLKGSRRLSMPGRHSDNVSETSRKRPTSTLGLS